MCLSQTDGLFAFAAAKFENYRVVVAEKLMPFAFQRESFLFDTLERIFEKILESLTFGKTLQFVFLSHGLIFYVTAKRLRYTLSL